MPDLLGMEVGFGSGIEQGAVGVTIPPRRKIPRVDWVGSEFLALSSSPFWLKHHLRQFGTIRLCLDSFADLLAADCSRLDKNGVDQTPYVRIPSVPGCYSR